jgi:two-component system sensor histidine kinase/response regulator
MINGPSPDPATLLTVLLQHAPEAIYFKDRESRFVCASQNLVRYLGCTMIEDIIGRTDSDFFGEDHAKAARRDELEIMRTGQPMLNREEREDFPDGTVRWSHTCKYPLRNHRDEIVGTFGISRDVTLIHEAQERLRQATDLLAAAGRIARLGHWQIDAAAPGIFWSEMTYELHGVPVGTQVTREQALAYYDPADRARLDAALATGTSFDIELRLRLAADRQLWVRMKGEVLHGAGHARRVTGILLDIDTLKRTEELLRERNQALEAATARAEQFAREAQAATRAKADFLANMSHEIRTPLNAVIGMAELLLGTPLSPRQRDFANTVRTSSDALLNDILDFSKIESGKLDLERSPFNLRDCVESALDIAARPAAAKGFDLFCELDPDLPPMLEGDVTRLRQVFINLLGNAVKFTERGEVLVTCRRRTLDGGLASLHASVRDTGIGIPDDRMDRLFKTFSQVDASTTRKYGGSGLGLVICERLVTMMGGRIWVESVVGQGSDFQFEIPLHAVAPVLPAEAEEAAHLPGGRILIVGGGATQRRILARETAGWGLSPVQVSDVSEALAELASVHRGAVLVIDLAAPGLDAPAFIDEIRRHPDGARLPVIALASLSNNQNLLAEKPGVRVISKPAKLRVLREALCALLPRTTAPAATTDAAPPSSQKPGERQPLRILIAEDQDVNREVVTLMLQYLGYTCDLAADGKQALAAVERQSYDVVFMDVQMPEMDGLEATMHLCQRHDLAHRPWIVAMTANALAGDRETCLATGMDDYISKPVSIAMLAQALAHAAAQLPLRRNYRSPLSA